MATTARTAQQPDLSLTEWVVLGLLAEGSTHGFAIAKELRPGTDLGRILTVHRPLVYRALDRLVAGGLAGPHGIEPGDAGPSRTLHRASRPGRRAVDQWLEEPVEHIRDLRIEFLIKVRFCERRDREPAVLAAAQLAALGATFEQLVDGRPNDVVESWRRDNAVAARRFLTRLAQG